MNYTTITIPTYLDIKLSDLVKKYKVKEKYQIIEMGLESLETNRKKDELAFQAIRDAASKIKFKAKINPDDLKIEDAYIDEY